jgi:hypothetical protein
MRRRTFCLGLPLGLGLGLGAAGCAGPPAAARPARPPSLALTAPAPGIVYQQDVHGRAAVPVAGHGAGAGAAIEARFTALRGGRGHGWRRVARADAGGAFTGRVPLAAGWYRAEFRAHTAGGPSAPAEVPRVGVGEVFLIAGHYVAQGGDINLPGSRDERVVTIPLPPAGQRRYERTGAPADLPPLAGAPFTDAVAPAPFGHGPYFWARFGELLAARRDVPVLLLNAAFGGTSLEHWAKSVRREGFGHGFVRADLRMPYRNVENALHRYLRATGLRALLADQGQNDWPEPDAARIAANYRTWLEAARADAAWPDLAAVVNRQTPGLRHHAVRAAQERVLREVPACFAGPDYDRLAPADRYDGIHLSAAGAARAAALWADALDAAFWQRSRPCPPR